MDFIKYIKKKLHVHFFNKIIASQYASFNYRNVVIECRCGERKIEKWHHDEVYPFLTNNFITNKEMNLLLQNNTNG